MGVEVLCQARGEEGLTPDSSAGRKGTLRDSEESVGWASGWELPFSCGIKSSPLRGQCPSLPSPEGTVGHGGGQRLSSPSSGPSHPVARSLPSALGRCLPWYNYTTVPELPGISSNASVIQGIRWAPLPLHLCAMPPPTTSLPDSVSPTAVLLTASMPATSALGSLKILPSPGTGFSCESADPPTFFFPSPALVLPQPSV